MAEKPIRVIKALGTCETGIEPVRKHIEHLKTTPQGKKLAAQYAGEGHVLVGNTPTSLSLLNRKP